MRGLTMPNQSAAKKIEDETNVVPLANVPMGLTVKGLIMEKIHDLTRTGDDVYYLAIVVKKIEKTMKVKVSKDVYDSAVEMTPYANTVIFNEYNGRIYWADANL